MYLSQLTAWLTACFTVTEKWNVYIRDFLDSISIDVRNACCAHWRSNCVRKWHQKSENSTGSTPSLSWYEALLPEMDVNSSNKQNTFFYACFLYDVVFSFFWSNFYPLWCPSKHLMKSFNSRNYSTYIPEEIFIYLRWFWQIIQMITTHKNCYNFVLCVVFGFHRSPTQKIDVVV